MSDSSSTVTNEGDSASETSPSFMTQIDRFRETDTPSTPSPDELEIMRQQGAIPKRPVARPLPPIPKSTPAGEWGKL